MILCEKDFQYPNSRYRYALQLEGDDIYYVMHNLGEGWVQKLYWKTMLDDYPKDLDPVSRMEMMRLCIEDATAGFNQIMCEKAGFDQEGYLE